MTHSRVFDELVEQEHHLAPKMSFEKLSETVGLSEVWSVYDLLNTKYEVSN